MEQIKEKIEKYLIIPLTDIEEMDVTRVLYNLELIRFYSLMETFTRKLLNI